MTLYSAYDLINDIGETIFTYVLVFCLLLLVSFASFWFP